MSTRQAEEDRNWFFNTELLVLAEQAGLRIHEVPVDWVEDPDSRVAIGTRTFVVDLSEVVQVVLGVRGLRGLLPAGLPPDQVHHGQQQRQQHDP
jgi:hypothetical protein